MMRMMRCTYAHTSTLPYSHTFRIWVLLLVLLTPACAKAPTAKQVLERATKQYDIVTDYTADVKVTVESPSIHMPEMAAKVYYKKPDKLKVDSRDGFAMIPRQGFVFGNPLREFAASSDLKLTGTERALDRVCYVVKGTFQREGRTFRSTVWVDGKDWLVRQIHTDSESEGSMKVKLWYRKEAGKYWMPATTTAQISFAAFPGAHPQDKPKPGRATTVIIRFANYRLNTGLSDKIFDKQERDS